MSTSVIGIDQLIADAAACRRCGKEHVLRSRTCTCVPECGAHGGHVCDHGQTWASPDDGHAYYRKTITVEWLRAWRDMHWGAK